MQSALLNTAAALADRTAERDQLRNRLERAYEELADWRARDTDVQSTAQALHEAEQRVVALLDENAQRLAERDAARHACRRTLAGQLLRLEDYP